MKIRSCFVSNSSSSSFSIPLDILSISKLEKIINHIMWGKRLGVDGADEDDRWDIRVTGDSVQGVTLMNNFDMRAFFKRINISDDVVEWDS